MPYEFRLKPWKAAPKKITVKGVEVTIDEEIEVEFDGVKLGKDMTIAQMINKKRVGDEITLLVVRDGKETKIGAKLEERPANL